MHSKRLISYCCCAVFLSLSLFASGAADIPLTDWSFSGPEGTESLDGTFPITRSVPPSKGAESQARVFAKFSLPSDWEGPVGVMLYKVDASVRVLVNGQPVDTIGRAGPKFFFLPYISRGVLVPAALLRPENELSLEMWNDVGSYKLRQVSLMAGDRWARAARLYDFLDVQLPRFACVILLFVAVYSMFLYINYRDRQESLYLSLASFFFAIYLLNVGISDAPVPYVALKAALYACFPVSIAFLFRFFRRFLRMGTGKRTIAAVTAVGAVFAVGYFFQRDTAALNRWHSLMLIYPFAAVFYGLFGAARDLIKGQWDRLSILLGIVAAILCSAYDVYYFALDLMPYILLQGIGFMSLIIGTFYCFSQEIADTNKRCVLYAAEMQKSKEARDALFLRIREDAGKSEAASQRLNESIDRVGALVSQYLVNIDHINMNIESQGSQVSANKDNMEAIFRALEETSGMIAHHENLVEVTVSGVRELTEDIQRTDSLAKASGETIRRLSGVCAAADREVAESARSVDDLASYSSNINEIVKSIGDLAEQTNILSINAAIEAARSGTMGKGFAVVAGEIRSLATKSGESANQINAILGTMVEKIRNIQRQEEQVSRRLREIAGENREVESAFAEIVDVLDRQRARNEMVGNTIAELVAAVHSIADRAAQQKTSGDNLSESFLLLENISQAILTSSVEQKACNEELKGNLERLRSVSEQNLEVLNDLRTLIS